MRIITLIAAGIFTLSALIGYEAYSNYTFPRRFAEEILTSGTDHVDLKGIISEKTRNSYDLTFKVHKVSGKIVSISTLVTIHPTDSYLEDLRKKKILTEQEIARLDTIVELFSYDFTRLSDNIQSYQRPSVTQDFEKKERDRLWDYWTSVADSLRSRLQNTKKVNY